MIQNGVKLIYLWDSRLYDTTSFLLNFSKIKKMAMAVEEGGPSEQLVFS